MARNMARVVGVPGALPPLLVSLAILATGFYVGYSSMGSASADPLDAVRGAEDPSFLVLLSFFVTRNVGAALLYYSGVLTGGFSTLLGWAITALYIGATFAAATTNVGFSAASRSIMWYAPLEVFGLVLAATAGLYPISVVLRLAYGRAAAMGERRDTGYLATYLRAARGSIRVLLIAVAIIIAAAVLEAAIITLR